MRKIILIQDVKHFDLLKKDIDVNKNCIIIFLNRFSISKEQFFFKKKNYYFYDEWIKVENQKSISNFLSNFLFFWYKNKNSKDLSIHNNFSIGMNFNESIALFSINFLKQYYSFKNLFKKTDTVYFYSQNTYTVEILQELQKKIRFNLILNSFSSKIHWCENDFMFQAIRSPSTISKNYIDFYYEKKNILKLKAILNNLCKSFLKIFLARFTPNGVLYLHSGKIEKFKKILYNKKIKKKIHWIINLNYIVEIFKTKKNLNFLLRSIVLRKDNELSIKVKDLINKVRLKKIKYLPCKKIFFDTFSKIFEKQFCASYFQYLSDYKDLIKIKPKLALITADNYPDHIIFAQASKNLGIKTAFYPHGLTGPGEIKLRKGNESIFDYFFALGKFDFDTYSKNGINKKNISIINHQHFENFISYKNKNKNKNKKFSKCLILDQDEGNDDPFFLMNNIYTYREQALMVAKKINVKVVCIKSREAFNNSNVKNIIYKEDIIPVYYDKDFSLSDLLDKVDFVIGPPGTALVESLLSNTPFFSFKTTKATFKKPLWKNITILDYIHLSKNAKELEYNIKNQNILKNKKYAKDFINLSNIKSPQDLYHFAENKIYKL